MGSVPASGARLLRTPRRTVFLTLALQKPCVFLTHWTPTDLAAIGFEQIHDRDPDRVGPARLNDPRNEPVLPNERQSIGVDRRAPRGWSPELGVVDRKQRLKSSPQLLME